MNLFEKTIREIEKPGRNGGLERALRRRLDSLTKPPGSLGRLEETAVKFGLITGSAELFLPKKRIVVFAGDHGIAKSGVSAYPPGVTPQMVRNILAGGAAVCVLARHAGAEVRVVDVGVDDPLAGAEGLVRRKVRSGTRDMMAGPAMTIEETIGAVEAGIAMAEEAYDEGVGLLGTGEMGIGNTTPSSALFAAMLPAAAEEVTGRGTGIGDERLLRKIDRIQRALHLHAHCLSDPLETLAAVGGFEIAGICGLILGAARRRIPVVVDGFISTAGALAASKLCAESPRCLFFSHCSPEPGHRRFFEKTGFAPLFDFDMRLGEGTGAALAMTVIDASIRIYNEMATFESAGVSGSVEASS